MFTADDAVAKKDQYGSVILVRLETSPEDIHGMEVANRGALRNPESLDFYMEMKNKLQS